MAEVFVSYARSTAMQAEVVARSLLSLGYSVWWDDELPPNRAYADVIEEQLRLARAVVVIWSADAVRSDWVRSEADRARNASKLVQLVVDGSLPPMPFDQIHCSDLSVWSGEDDNHAWRKVVKSVSELVRSTPATTVQPTPANNLPMRHGLIGREADMGRIARLFERSDLVTVTGAGGVGKTRIAIEVARTKLGYYEDGVWLVEFAPVSDPTQVPGAVARAMNIQLPAGKDPALALVERLRPRDCLIVLDNCEHVIDAVARLAEAVLEHSTKVKLLVTSQELLTVDGELTFHLRPLREPAAAALFAERARAADANFIVRPRDAATVAAICLRLDGMPLAIEMAAARAPSLGCESVLQRLDDRFRILTGGRRTALPRHRTMVATLDWSHGLLSATDAAVLRRLGVFAGEFTLEAASDVAADDIIGKFEVVDALSSLVAKSLASAEIDESHTRYRLLETTRAYALEKLASAGETEATQRRHAEYFVKFTTQARPDYYRIDDDAFYARYVPDMDNIKRAIEWAFGPTGDAETGIALIALSYTVWVFQSLVPEYSRWLEIAAGRVTPVTPEHTRILLLRSQASANMGSSPLKTLKVVDQVIDALRSSGDPILLGDPLCSKLSALLNLPGHTAEAQSVAAELEPLIADAPPSRLKVNAQLQLGGLALALDDPAKARSTYDAGIATAETIGADGWAHFLVAATSNSRAPNDDPDTAIAGLRDLLVRIRPTHMLSGQTVVQAASRLVGLLAVRGAQGDVEEAMRVARAHEKLAGRAPAHHYVLNLAMLAFRSGRPHDAARLIGFTEAQHEAAGVDSIQWLGDFEQAWTLIGGGLSRADLTALQAEGRRLTQDDAFQLAMGAEGGRSREAKSTVRKARLSLAAPAE